MKEQLDTLITTGTHDATMSTGKMLESAGIVFLYDDHIPATTCSEYFSRGSVPAGDVAAFLIKSNGAVITHKLRTQGKFMGRLLAVYHHADLTTEICQSLPGARQLPPVGPFEFEGRMWEVDGVEKRPRVYGVACLGCLNIPTREFSGTSEGWILRPVITEELQAAITHQKQTASVVSEARKSNREAMDRVADLRSK